MTLARNIRQRDTMAIATSKAEFLSSDAAAALSIEQRRDALRAIEDGYRRGIRDWAKDYLPDVTGPDKAREILSQVQPEAE